MNNNNDIDIEKIISEVENNNKLYNSEDINNINNDKKEYQKDIIDLKLVWILHLLSWITWIWIFLTIWYFLLKKDDLSYNEDQALRNVINFHISYLIYVIISFILMFLIIWFFTIIAVWILYIIFAIVWFIKLLMNEVYEFPLTIKML